MFSSQNGDFDIQKKHLTDTGIFVITSGRTNNGILGKTAVNAKIFNSKTITVDMFGYAYYRPFKYKMVTHARVFSLKPKFDISDNQGLFLANSLHFLYKFFGYDNMCSWEKIKSEKIQLPTKNGEIDFDFMESFIAELEAERMAQLTSYLKASGLDNYELSVDEKKAINSYPNTEFKEFSLISIFDVINTHNILSSDIIANSGEVPYLCASANNNSVSTYIKYDKDYLEKGHCIFIGGKTFVVSYQENDFFSNDSHNLVLYLKDYDATKLIYLYLATCVRRSLDYKYSWGNSISKAKIQKDKIYLPVKDNKIDFETMELLMSAIQKLVIKDVVLYADKKIEATKTVVSAEQ